jgi:hypothetical protein
MSAGLSSTFKVSISRYWLEVDQAKCVAWQSLDRMEVYIKTLMRTERVCCKIEDREGVPELPCRAFSAFKHVARYAQCAA